MSYKAGRYFAPRYFALRYFATGADSDEVIGFAISPNVYPHVATISIAATGFGTAWTGDTPFTVASGPGTISNLVIISDTSATFDLEITSLGPPIIISDSDSGMSIAFATSTQSGMSMMRRHMSAAYV